MGRARGSRFETPRVSARLLSVTAEMRAGRLARDHDNRGRSHSRCRGARIGL